MGGSQGGGLIEGSNAGGGGGGLIEGSKGGGSTERSNGGGGGGGSTEGSKGGGLAEVIAEIRRWDGTSMAQVDAVQDSCSALVKRRNQQTVWTQLITFHSPAYREDEHLKHLTLLLAYIANGDKASTEPKVLHILAATRASVLILSTIGMVLMPISMSATHYTGELELP